MAAAAKPNGQMKVGQVSPTRKLSDFHKKVDKGNDHRRRQQNGDRLAAAISAPRRQRDAGQNHRQQDKTDQTELQAR